jgi:flagellar basal body P-ring formation protein FlgA
MKNLFSFLLIIIMALAAPAWATPGEAPATQPNYLFELSFEDAQNAIGQALVEKGAGTQLAASINGRKKDALFSYNKPLTVEIRGLQFDKNARSWSANLLMISEGDVVTAMPVAGRFEDMVEVPVLRRQIRNGEIIGESDVDLRQFPVAHTRPGTIRDKAELIGKSPSRASSAFRPIREHEIASPAVVKKNGIVQMRYLSPGMEITATGQAMNEGGRGEVIAVRNMNSKKIVRAVVEDANTVSILSATQSSQLTGDSAYETN